ncbi:MAG TPA: hypothetical protein DCP92_24790 [Nitrospiraceae bacterium]|nr:hypothetical protein [Nitrospiraceae bacterium]
MHRIANHLDEHECYFTPYYGDGIVKALSEWGMLDFTVLGGRFREQTEGHLHEHRLRIDYRGQQNNYDLVVTCQDLIIQRNITKKKIVLVQEGMTDPENILYHLVRKLKLPRYLASTSMTGLSHCYERFCVASEGYRELFIRKGVNPKKLAVTGIPNFDDIARGCATDFPHKHFVLVATSDARETFKLDNRRKFIRKAQLLAGGRPMIFKLHPNERPGRAKEISRIIPDALVFQDCDINPMIANCDVLITQYSSVAYVGLALGKEVHSYFDREELKRLMPMQNGGTSAQNIAHICREYLAS